jgi:hypothetical protein
MPVVSLPSSLLSHIATHRPRWRWLLTAAVLGLTACAQTPPVQRMVFTVRDARKHLPVAEAKTTITLSRQPLWFHGQPITLTTDSHGSSDALLVCEQTGYHFHIQAAGYPDTDFELPVLSEQFPFDQWLAPTPADDTNKLAEPATTQPQNAVPVYSPLELKIQLAETAR